MDEMKALLRRNMLIYAIYLEKIKNLIYVPLAHLIKDSVKILLCQHDVWHNTAPCFLHGGSINQVVGVVTLQPHLDRIFHFLHRLRYKKGGSQRDKTGNEKGMLVSGRR